MTELFSNLFLVLCYQLRIFNWNADLSEISYPITTPLLVATGLIIVFLK